MGLVDCFRTVARMSLLLSLASHLILHYNADVANAITCLKEGCSYICTDGCKSSTIDASAALSLTVNCTSEYSCAETTIKCPSTNNSTCIVNCMEDNSCENIVIEANQSDYVDTFKLFCNSKFGICQGGKVMLDFTKTTSLDLQLNSGANNGEQIYFDYGNKITNIDLFNYVMHCWM